MKKTLIILLALSFCLALSGGDSVAGSGLFDISNVDMGNVSGNEDAEVEIELRNITGVPIRIEKVDTSCGCTVANTTDESIAPGESTKVKVRIDTRGKMGDISKELKLFTSEGETPHVLTLTGKVEHFGDSIPDPSVIFKGECADCHVGEGIEEKKGQVLYNSVCFLCHRNGIGAEAAVSVGLSNVIARGIPGTSMPGFSKKAGGPLVDKQIESLTDYVREKYLKGN